MPRGCYEHSRRPMSDRFWEKVDRRKHNECWPWLASKNENGYGIFQTGRGEGCELAHRVAFALHTRTWPKECILHSCDNPACCNPNHLREGTPADNSADMVSRKRHRHGERHPTAKLTASEVRKMRELFDVATDGAIGMMFNVASETVRRIRIGANWKHD